jgi:hypothetical protein
MALTYDNAKAAEQLSNGWMLHNSVCLKYLDRIIADSILLRFEHLLERHVPATVQLAAAKCLLSMCRADVIDDATDVIINKVTVVFGLNIYHISILGNADCNSMHSRETTVRIATRRYRHPITCN